MSSEYRSKGLGKELIKIIISWRKNKGFAEFATDTELNNTKAQNFYTAAGFQETDRIVEFRIEMGKT